MRLVALSPSTTLDVPPALDAAIAAAVHAGRDEAAGWARIHPTGSTSRFDRDARSSIEAPATGSDRDGELDVVRSAQQVRTDAGITRAKQLAARAGWDVWEVAISRIGATQGPEQARLAQRLIDESAGRTHEIVNDAKHAFGRPRPYLIDPSITPIVDKPHGNPAYPSGHTSGAFAAALILAAFVPAREAAGLLDIATEVGYSRIYGGVHYPSDVVVGARIASRVAADVLRRHGRAH